MKRILTLLLAAALLLGLALPMTSCSAAARLSRMDETKRADYFYRVTDRNASYARSGSYDQTMVLDATLNGVAYKQTTVATVTFLTERDGVTYLEQAKTTVDVVGGGTVIYEDSGYVDGMMFRYSKEGNNETALKSPISLEDYGSFRQYQNASAPLIAVGEGISETMTCKQNEDGTWTATYEDFTAEGLKPFLYMLRGIDYVVTAEHDIVDVRLTLNADEKLYLTSLKMEFVFEAKTETSTPTPVVTMENKYHGWNNTTLSEPYDLSSFTEVADLRAVDVFTSALMDRASADSGAFDVKVVTKANGSGYNNTVTNKQKVTFSSEGGYRFNYEYDEDGYDYKIGYMDGNMTVRVYEDGEKVHSETVDMTESEARATVSQLMDPEGITAQSISGVEIIDAEKGIVRFALSDAFENSYKEQYEMTGMNMTAFDGYCEATLAEGILTEYRYHMEMTVRMNGQSVKTTVDMTITFDAEQGSETV